MMENYWEVKCKMLQLQLEQQQLDIAQSTLNRAKEDTIKQYNLGLGGKYKFNDNTMEIEEVS